MLTTKRSLNILAGVVILGILGALGVRLWATGRETKIQGPGLVAANRNAAYVYMNQLIYQLDAKGKIVNTLYLGDLNFSRPPCDMQALSDGRLLIGNYDERSIYECSPDFYSCSVLFNLPAVDILASPEAIVESDAFDFFLDEFSGQLYIADAVQHTLSLADLHSGELLGILDKEDLKFPNDLFVERENDRPVVVRVADSLHRRIAGVRIENESFKAFENDFDGRTDYSTPHKTYPIGLTKGSDNNWWVLNADHYLINAEVIVYANDGHPLRQVPLPPKADPVSIATFKGQVLIADPIRFHVDRIDPATDSVSQFGGSDFLKDASRLQARAQGFHMLSTAAFFAMGPFIILCFFVIFKASRLNQPLKSSSPAAAPSPPAEPYDGIHWVAFDLESFKIFKNFSMTFRIVLGVCTILFLLLFALLLYMEGLQNLRLMMLLGSTSILIVAVLFLSKAVLPVPVRIGTDGRYLYAVDAKGQSHRSAPEATVYSQNFILCQKVIVYLKLLRWRQTYDQNDFIRHIAPLLMRARKISEISFGLQILKHNPAQQFLLAAAVIFPLVIFFFIFPIGCP